MYLDPLAFTELARVMKTRNRPTPVSTANIADRKVLLPFDGSRSACRALDHVIEGEFGRGSHVHVLYVQEPTLDDRAFLESSLQSGEEIVGWARGKLEAAGIPHSSEIAVGVPREMIVERARSQKCTAIVMGVRGAIARFFSGSVSDEVVRLAGVPVTRIR